MSSPSYRKRNLRLLLLIAVIGLLVASCNNVPIPCLPAEKVSDIKIDTITVPKWKLDISDSVEVRMIVAKDQSGSLAPRAVFTDTIKQRVAVLPLELFLSSPVYIAWVDDEISKTLSDGQTYTTIHTFGYVSPELYPGKKLDSADFLFESKPSRPTSDDKILSKLSVFQEGVLWFPTTDSDFENYKYLGFLTIDTEESLATNASQASPVTNSEWKENFDPGIEVASRLVKLSQLDWIDISKDTGCVTPK